MKRNLRFYFALMFARGTALVLKLIGRKGTSMPGSWAIILCPDFIGRMPKPKKIIGITGTNGKTTVSNMIEDVLEDNGIEFMCNRSGTNVATGVASTLIANSHFFGKPKCDLAVFELDERSAPNIYPYMQPDIVLCTNIFRDSYKRNAHAEFILDILKKDIPKGTKVMGLKIDAVGKANVLNKEIMGPIVVLKGYESFEEAVAMAIQNMEEAGGIGHTAGIFSNDRKHIEYYGERIPVARVLVNQPTPDAWGPSTNGLSPAVSESCGTWGNNILCENVDYIHLTNVSKIALPLDVQVPSPEELFKD